MRIAIVGIGDYGGRFAARLTNSGADVTLIARGQTLERLRREGLNAGWGLAVAGPSFQARPTQAF